MKKLRMFLVMAVVIFSATMTSAASYYNGYRFVPLVASKYNHSVGQVFGKAVCNSKGLYEPEGGVYVQSESDILSPPPDSHPVWEYLRSLRTYAGKTCDNVGQPYHTLYGTKRVWESDGKPCEGEGKSVAVAPVAATQNQGGTTTATASATDRSWSSANATASVTENSDPQKIQITVDQAQMDPEVLETAIVNALLKVEQAKIEMAEKAAKKAAAEKARAERLEAERLAAEKAEAERLEAERAKFNTTVKTAVDKALAERGATTQKPLKKVVKRSCGEGDGCGSCGGLIPVKEGFRSLADFQEKNNLTDDGICGKDTLEAAKKWMKTKAKMVTDKVAEDNK